MGVTMGSSWAYTFDIVRPQVESSDRDIFNKKRRNPSIGHILSYLVRIRGWYTGLNPMELVKDRSYRSNRETTRHTTEVPGQSRDGTRSGEPGCTRKCSVLETPVD